MKTFVVTGILSCQVNTLTVEADVLHVSVFLHDIENTQVGHAHILALLVLLLLFRRVTHHRELYAVTANERVSCLLELDSTVLQQYFK